LSIIKANYCGPFNVKKNGVLVKAFLEGHALDLLCAFFKDYNGQKQQIILERGLSCEPCH
jgi:hypothetical protein